MKLRKSLLQSGNFQIRFEIIEGPYSGHYGYLLSREDLCEEEVSEYFRRYMERKKRLLPFSILSPIPLKSPLYLN